MSEKRFTVSVDEQDNRAIALLRSLGQFGRFQVGEAPEPEDKVGCPICGLIVPVSMLRRHEYLPEPVCELCHDAAHRILAQANADAHRHWNEIIGQLLTAVRDLRATGEMPTFYRGFE